MAPSRPASASFSGLRVAAITVAAEMPRDLHGVRADTADAEHQHDLARLHLADAREGVVGRADGVREHCEHGGVELAGDRHERARRAHDVLGERAVDVDAHALDPDPGVRTPVPRRRRPTAIDDVGERDLLAGLEGR